MKPLRLTLRAFGPYPDRQTIDFRAALNSGLFGIYGATGSGKSTIFSAMTFALFGEAARSEQDAKTLRSDHADAETMTEVELVFETGGRQYRIVRRPEQMRPAKRGGGETREAHKAWLYEATGLDIEMVGDDRPGKVIAETKVSTVDDEIVRLLGYSAAQFRQIVLLPQGRFETFLSAKTDERVKILRELFDVKLYRRLTEHLKEKAKSVEGDIKTSRAVCNGRLNAEGFESGQALGEGIEAARAKQVDLAAAAVEAKAASDAASKLYEAAAKTDQAFAEHVAAEKALAEVESRGGAVREAEDRLKGARIAQALADADAAVAGARAEAGRADRLSAETRERLGTAQAAACEAAEVLKTLAARSPEIETLRARRVEYRGCDKQLEQCESLRLALIEVQKKARDNANRHEETRARHEEFIGKRGDAEKRLAAARESELRRVTLKMKGAETASLLKAAEAHERAAASVLQERMAVTQLSANHEAEGRRLAESAAAFQTVEAELLESHALHLAAHLAPGAPCPVCGSPEHPSPARGRPGEADLVEAYERGKVEYEAQRAAANNVLNDLRAAQDRCSLRERELDQLVAPERPSAEVMAELKGLSTELAALGAETDITALETQLRGLDAQAAAAQQELDTAREAKVRSAADEEARRRALDDALRDIPEELRSAGKLAAALGRIEGEIASYEKELEDAKSRERQASHDLVAANSDAANAEANRKLAAQRLTDACSAFEARLSRHGVSMDTYEASKGDVARIPELEKLIREHGEQRAITRARVDKAAAAIQSVDRPDIVGLKEARDVAEAQLKAAQEKVFDIGSHLKQLERLREDIAAELARLDRLEEETGPLRELAAACDGRNNAKVDLETFAIATMFDSVLEAANLRLGPMTRGRYSLTRELGGGGNARRGLGIAVEDSHTGRQRPPSTLSGGEMFIHALALALGLSDVVESTRGNIRLDAVFIDEGFGSLDSDGDAGTLEQVLQTLQDLVGRGRSIGLISHVPLVQQAIPNGFWVTSTTSGSHVEERA